VFVKLEILLSSIYQLSFRTDRETFKLRKPQETNVDSAKQSAPKRTVMRFDFSDLLVVQGIFLSNEAGKQSLQFLY